jgi:DNA uptake protein ComE-like DNA-binding protein
LALIAVLWIAALMMALVSVAAQTSLLDSRVSQLENEKQRGRWACRGGVETAIALLLEDDRSYDALTDLWATNPLELEQLDFGGVTVDIQVVDVASKLNVNTATREQLLALPDMTEDIADSILDWVDSDEDIRPGGAESGYYLNLDIGYWARNGAIRTDRELLRIKGITEGLFYGERELELLSADNEGWMHYLTCYSRELNQDSDGNRKININRADRETLITDLGLSEGQAQWVLDNRPFRQFADMIGQTSTTTATASSAGSSAFGQSGATGSTARSAASQTTGAASRQTQTSSGQATGQQQQEQPAAEPLDMATVLELADKATLTNRRTLPGKVNLNTAGETVLTALFEDNRELAQNVIAAREGLGGVFLSLADLQQVEGMSREVLQQYLDQMTLRSSIYEIHVTAVSQATGLTWQVQAIVDREAAQGQIIYWREGISR